MLKNAYFLKKIVKNRLSVGGSTPELPFASGGPSHQLSCIVNSPPCIYPQITDSFGINQKTLFSCNYIGSAPGFRRRKKMRCISYATDYGNNNHRFQIFSFCSPHSFCAGAAPINYYRKYLFRIKNWGPGVTLPLSENIPYVRPMATIHPW